MSKKKEYPLEIHGEYDAELFFSRGHHDKASFIEQLQEYFGVTANESDVEHCYYRLTPSENWSDFRMSYTEAYGPGRGAFPMTVVKEYHRKTELL